MSSEHKILIKPIISEKSTLDRELERKYYFEVAVSTNKPEVKKAVEKMYNVKVESVNILNRVGKTKRVRYKQGKTATRKIAIVKLKEDNFIKQFEGV